MGALYKEWTNLQNIRRIMAAGDPGGAPLNPNDFTNGDHSWKNFIVMTWKTQFLKLWIIGVVLTILQLFHLPWCIDTIIGAFQDGVLGGLLTCMGMLIPLTWVVLIGYKGLYQYWNDMKNGISR